MKSTSFIQFKRKITQNFSFAKFILLPILIVFLLGCRHYYKVTREHNVTSQQINELRENSRYILLHSQNKAWLLENVLIDDDTIYGRLNSYLGYHEYYLNPKPKGVNRYKNQHKSKVLNEAHIYTSANIPNNMMRTISIPINSIEKVEIYDPARGATTFSWLAPPLAIIGITAAIAASSSCPFLYIDNGQNYVFRGEIYAGATCQPLERHDYMLLSDFDPINEQYQLKISNQLKERQYTNLAELLLFKHPDSIEVLVDKYGSVHTLSALQTPKIAQSLNYNDFTQAVSSRNNEYFLFLEDNTETTLNNLVVTFINHDNSEKGKLVVNAKNSLWSDHTYSKFTELFGTYYPKWENQQNRISTKRHEKRILKQDIPLSVYIETDKGWEFVDYYNVVGPFAAKDMVLSIDLSKAKSKDVRIKLESGFMFWELDYVAMDFSKNVQVEKAVLKPARAIDEKGNDVTNLIYDDDIHYLNQPNIGNEVIVNYDFPEKDHSLSSNYKNTVILHSKGYYERISNYTNKPQWMELMALRRPHSFSRFSWEEYKKTCKEYEILSMKNESGSGN